MGIIGSREDEQTFINPLKYKWCNECKKDVHLSCFKTYKDGTYYSICKNHNKKS